MISFFQYLTSGIAYGVIYALLGAGFVVVHRVTRVVNIAQGMVVVVAVFAIHSLMKSGLPLGVAAIIGVLVAGVAGLLVGSVVLARSNVPVVVGMVVTFGLAVAMWAIEIIIWGQLPVSFRLLSGTTSIGGLPVRNQLILVVMCGLAAYAALILFFDRTLWGRAMTACASNPFAARLVGLKPKRIGLLAFFIAGVLGGIAGLLVAPLQSVSFDSDVELAISGFAAGIFGGLDKPSAALLGGVIIGVAESMVAGYISGAYSIIIALSIMVAVMIWRASRQSAFESEAV